MRIVLFLLIILLVSLGFGACCFLHELSEPETSTIHIQDKFFVTSAQMQTLTQEQRESFKNPREFGLVLPEGHRILPGQRVVLLFRDFYADPWSHDGEQFEKLTVELTDYAPQEKLKVPSAKVRVFYSEGSSVWRAGGYATSGSGKVIVKSMNPYDDSLVVFLDLHLKLQPGMESYARKTKTIKGEFRLQKRELSSLDDWLGGAGLWRKGWAEVNDSLETYVQGLKTSDPQVRYLAAYQLSYFKDEPAVDALVTALRTERDAGVRRSILATLSNLGDKSVVPEFLSALKDCNPRIRTRAVEGLEKIGDASVIPSLREALNDESYFVRQLARQAITRLEKEEAR